MMHVNETGRDWAVDGTQVNVTCRACPPVVANACFACVRVALIAVNEDLFNGTLDISDTTALFVEFKS
jgi:hypothetical protein